MDSEDLFDHTPDFFMTIGGQEMAVDIKTPSKGETQIEAYVRDDQAYKDLLAKTIVQEIAVGPKDSVISRRHPDGSQTLIITRGDKHTTK